MKRLIGPALVAGLCAGAALSDPHGSFRAPLNDPSDRAAIEQIEREMGDAMVALDLDKLGQMYAEDFVSLSSSGKLITKEKMMTDFRSGTDRLVSYALGPIDVQVLGNVAVGHGSVTEKRFRNGKEDNSEAVWMDLFEKRAGKWVVVRSEGAVVK
jgi:ketosteroid isomerase-like protein